MQSEFRKRRVSSMIFLNIEEIEPKFFLRTFLEKILYILYPRKFQHSSVLIKM
jgi:hypothetical protein